MGMTAEGNIPGHLLRILLYFDVFSYPLTRREIICYSGLERNKWLHALKVLDSLVSEGVINYCCGSYYIGKDRSKVLRRSEGNRRAAERMKSARKYSRIISYFPFVRGIFISGSLSKGYASEKDDIDYFIVTRPGRLWLVRTMLTVFKKIFLFNSYRNFCINYFVDEDHLFIKEHNRFTATEIVFLIPVFNRRLYNEFLDRNSWVRSYYPNFRQKYHFCHEKDPALKRWIEGILGNSLGDILESYFFRLSRNYIKKKFSYMDRELFSSSFTMLRHELRYLPGRQQFNILTRYNEKVKKFEKEGRLAISSSNLVESETVSIERYVV